MGYGINVISNDVRIRIKHNGVAMHLLLHNKSQAQSTGSQSADQPNPGDFLVFPDKPDVNKRVVHFNVVFPEGSNIENLFSLSTNLAYYNSSVKFLCMSEQGLCSEPETSDAYIMNPYAKRGALLQACYNKSTHKVKILQYDSNGNPLGYFYLSGKSKNNTYLKRTEKEQDAAEFDIDIFDRPDIIKVKENDTYHLNPVENYSSYWMTDRKTVGHNGTTEERIPNFDPTKPSEFDCGNSGKVFFFELPQEGPWTFANEKESVTSNKALIIGDVTHEHGLYLSGNGTGNSRIISTKLLNNCKRLQVTVNGETSGFPTFVFKAKHTSGVIYCSKDPTATERETQ